MSRNVDMNDIVSYALTGGQIKNSVLMAARFAAYRDAEKLNHEDFVTAIRKVQQAGKAFEGKESIATQYGIR